MEDVAKTPYLVRPSGRRSSYAFRRRVPEHLQKIIGKTEFRESLRTADYKTAKSRCLSRAVEVDTELRQAEALFEQAKSISSGKAIKFRLPLSHEHARDLAKLWYQRRYANVDRELAMRFSHVSVAEHKSEASKYTKRKTRFQQKEAKAIAFSRNQAKAIAKEFGFHVVTAVADKRAEPFNLLADYIRRAEVEVCRFGEMYLIGQEAEFELADFIRDTDPGKTETRLRSINDRVTLKGLIAAHKSDKKALARKGATQKKWGTFYRLLEDFFEPGCNVAALDRNDFKEFRDFLEEAPLRTPVKYKGMSKREVWEETRGQGHKVRSPKTVNDYLSYLHGLMKFAATEKYVKNNEAVGLQVPEKKKRSKRDEFSSADLKKIFDHPLYRGCVNDGRRYNVPGPNIIKGGRFWSILLAFYTGMREREIFQLYVADIRCEDGVWYIDNNENSMDGEVEKSLKSAAAWRKVPVHDELIRLGFIKFAEAQKERQVVRLFDDLPVSKSVDPANTFQKWCIRFLKDAGVHVKGKKGFHSIRHTFVSELRRNGVPRETVEEITGHAAREGEHNTYYKGDRLTALQAAVNKLKYEGLDLSHLYE